MLTSGDRLDWRRFCGTNNPEGDGCVETVEQGDTVLVRNSNDPDAGMLSFTQGEIADFVEGWPSR